MNAIMKKTLTVILAIIMVLPVALPVIAGQNNNPNKWLGSPAYVLNIHGKKADWNANGDFSNPDRHTMFMPQGSEENPSMVKFFITQALKGSTEPFMVLDGNAFDDNELRLQMADGYFAVYVTALGKPLPESQSTDVKGVVADENGDPIQFLGLVDAKSLKPHGKTPVWDDYSDLFYIDEDQMYAYLSAMTSLSDETIWNVIDHIMNYFESIGAVMNLGTETEPRYAIWIFDFYEYLANNLEYLFTPEEQTLLDNILDGQYYWDLKNRGIRHIQVRFYLVGNRVWQDLQEPIYSTE
jgi:hypothetical protein